MLDQTSYNQESEISLFELFLMIKKYFLFLVIFTLIGGGLASIYAFGFAPKTYQSDVEIVVNGQQQSIKDFIISDKVVLEAVRNSDLNISVHTVQSGLNITFNTSSKFMDISLKLDDARYTNMLLSEILDVVKDYAENDPIYVSYKGLISTPTAVSNDYLVGPNYFLIIFIGMLLAGFVSLGYVFIREMMFPKYHSKESIEKNLECDCIGVIPLYSSNGGETHV